MKDAMQRYDELIAAERMLHEIYQWIGVDSESGARNQLAILSTTLQYAGLTLHDGPDAWDRMAGLRAAESSLADAHALLDRALPFLRWLNGMDELLCWTKAKRQELRDLIAAIEAGRVE